MNFFPNRGRRLFVVAAALAISYGAFGFLLLPPIIKRAAVHELGKFLGRSVAIRSVDFNPFALSATIRGLSLEGADGGAFLSMDSFHADIQPLASLLERSWVFREMIILGPRLGILRDEKGAFDFADLLLLDWPTDIRFRFGLLRIADGEISFHDASLPGGFSTTIGPFSAELRNFSSGNGKEGSFSLAAVSEAAERLSMKGRLRLNPLSSRGEIAVEKLSLKKYFPYVMDRFNLTVASGTLSGSAAYDLDLAPASFTASLRDGTLKLLSVSSLEGSGATPLLSLAELSIAGASVDAARRTIDVASLTLSGLSARLRLLPDGSLNLQHVAKAARPAPAPRARSLPEWKLSVADTALRDGRLRFEDDSMRPPLSTELTQLDMRIGGLSSAGSRPASVDVSAAIGGSARFQIHGTSDPFGARGETRLRALLQNLELSALSPYAAKYLGYALRAGELSLESAWSIRGRRLDARNTIGILRLKLGKKTASATSPKLNLPLAIALIRDKNGKITLEVPISGTLDDPRFDFRKTMMQALFTPLAKAAASPFAALGERLGKGGAELAFQDFLPMSAELEPLETAKLEILIEALKRWPDFMLDIEGSVDAKEDSGDLRLLAASRAMAVKDYLVRQGKLEPDRIFLIEDPKAEVANKGSRALLYLKDQYREPG